MNGGNKQLLCKLPFQPALLCRQNGHLLVVDEAESIARHLILLITTVPGENRGDKEYGNALLEAEFENARQAEWETKLIATIESMITKYEPRLAQPRVQVKIVFARKNYAARKLVVLKKKAMIYVNARLTSTSENFSFSTEIFLSPLSVD